MIRDLIIMRYMEMIKIKINTGINLSNYDHQEPKIFLNTYHDKPSHQLQPPPIQASIDTKAQSNVSSIWKQMEELSLNQLSRKPVELDEFGNPRSATSEPCLAPPQFSDKFLLEDDVAYTGQHYYSQEPEPLPRLIRDPFMDSSLDLAGLPQVGSRRASTGGWSGYSNAPAHIPYERADMYYESMESSYTSLSSSSEHYNHLELHRSPSLQAMPNAIAQDSAPGYGILNRYANLNLDDLVGQIYFLCKDQYGCRFLQKQIEELHHTAIKLIFAEIFSHSTELMIGKIEINADPFGNYLCQKLIEFCSDEQRTEIVQRVAPDLIFISLNMHGTRAVQKLIEAASSPYQIQTITTALNADAVSLIKDLNGNHVIQKCLNKLSSDDNQVTVIDLVCIRSSDRQLCPSRNPSPRLLRYATVVGIGMGKRKERKEVVEEEFPEIDINEEFEDDVDSADEGSEDEYKDIDDQVEDLDTEVDSQVSDVYEEFEEKRVRVLRKKQLPEIDPVYDSDTSDEENYNTVGNIPMEWYDEYPHIGYDVNGNKIMRPAQGDDLDKFLSTMDDKNAWRSVYDKLEGKNIVLNKEELEMLKRIQQHQFPETMYDPYEPTVEWFSGTTEVMPLSGAHEPKRRFIPSKLEASKIMRIAKAIRAGLIVPGQKKKVSDKPKFYDIWDNKGDENALKNHIPAPKLKLPEHNESYNPPSEYVLSKDEEREWEDLDPEDRPHNFLPKKHSTLRQVGAYQKFIQERFERCLDLYLCPRTVKQKLDIDPESLIPKLPSPKDLKPFPTKLSITYKGHSAKVRNFCLDPTGQWIASGSDDKTVKIWEVSTGRNIKTFKLEEVAMAVSWSPSKTVSLIAVATGEKIILLQPGVANEEIIETTTQVIASAWENVKNAGAIKWEKPNASDSASGHCIHITLPKTVTSIAWHRRGDYFASVSPDGSSQNPFKKSKGLVQKVIFHPTKPFLFVATQRSVKIYNLVKQELIKKLMPGSKWISSIDIHPAGDNLIIGTYDKRIHWFDMDLSAKPYKTLRYHQEAVRQVSYHKRYPLFASSSDDGSVLLFHGMVYNDLMQNPLIVPLKTLKAHERVESLGALDCQWHPIQPWIFSSGADNTIKLFV
ncbi:Ribosome biogenesis protein erb1 [Terramyces sp. JEL0728]|nr:Ribosome biogenesis protein erb1 [Terramyces sp. JEL0728]